FELFESPAVLVPTVVGALRSALLVPTSAITGLAPPLLDALLAHELAHIRRYDGLVNLAQLGIEVVLFYHPAVWWVSGQLRAGRENCCDDLAVSLLGDRVLYARALVSLEQLRARPGAMVLAGNGGALACRIRRLLGLPCRDTSLAGGMVAGMAVAALLAAL